MSEAIISLRNISVSFDGESVLKRWQRILWIIA